MSLLMGAPLLLHKVIMPSFPYRRCWTGGLSRRSPFSTRLHKAKPRQKMQNTTRDRPSNRGSDRLAKMLLTLMISSSVIGAGVMIWGPYKLYTNKKEVSGYIQSVYHR